MQQHRHEIERCSLPRRRQAQYLRDQGRDLAGLREFEVIMGQQRKNIGWARCRWNALHRRDRLLILASLLVERGQRQVGIAIVRRNLQYRLVSRDRLRRFSL